MLFETVPAPSPLYPSQKPPSCYDQKPDYCMPKSQAYIPPKRRPTPQANPQPIIMGQIRVAVAIGDDNATNVITHHDVKDPGNMANMFSCELPFICYSEGELSLAPIGLTVTGVKWRRIFFDVVNTGAVVIPHATLVLASQTPGVSVYQMDQRKATPQRAFEWNPTQVVDLVPYSTSDGGYDFPADVTIDDGVSDFTLAFRVFADNLKARTILSNFHVSR